MNIPNLNHNISNFLPEDIHPIETESQNINDEQTKHLINQSKHPVCFKIENVSTLPENNKRCVICMIDFENGENILCLPCIHFFHQPCIDKWFTYSDQCPQCKTYINLDMPLHINSDIDETFSYSDVSQRFENVSQQLHGIEQHLRQIENNTNITEEQSAQRREELTLLENINNDIMEILNHLRARESEQHH